MNTPEFGSESEAPICFPFDRTWELGEAVTLACLLESAAPKAGNVHPNRPFQDMNFVHFLGSSSVLGQVLRDCSKRSVGELIRQAVARTQQQVAVNTNLGTVLLMAPIAKATEDPQGLCRGSIATVLNELDESDTRYVYEAIRLANPGGLGDQEADDVNRTPPQDLIAAMERVAGVDAVARQFTNGYSDITERLLPWLNAALHDKPRLAPLEAICLVQIRWLAHEPDGLIARKSGHEVAEQVQNRARLLLSELEATAEISQHSQFLAFDAFLRSDGHRLNPGTTADLIATTLLFKLIQPDH